jgi:hypothetical protein
MFPRKTERLEIQTSVRHHQKKKKKEKDVRVTKDSQRFTNRNLSVSSGIPQNINL